MIVFVEEIFQCSNQRSLGATYPLANGGTVGDEGICLNPICTVDSGAATIRFIAAGGTAASTSEPLFEAFFFN